MKYNLQSVGQFYHTKDKEKLEKLGFQFKPTKEVYGEFTLTEWYKTTEGDDIELHTLEDLFRFTEEWGACIVSGQLIIIYDDYRE